MESRSFVFQDGKSDKFWTITLDGSGHSVQFGRCGTAGQTQTKELGSAGAARSSYDKLVAEKPKKGYTEEGSAKPVVAKVAVKPAVVVTPDAPAAAPPRPALTLTPEELLFAPWRPRTVLARPAPPPPFDLEEATRKVATLIPKYFSGPNWASANLHPSMSAEEARFWLFIMIELATHGVEVTRTRPPAGYAPPTAAELRETVAALPFSSCVILPLSILYAWSDVCEFIRGFQYRAMSRFSIVGSNDNVFRRCVLPYLTDSQLSELRSAVQSWFDTSSPAFVAVSLGVVPVDLAPMCGASKVVRAILQGVSLGLDCQFAAGLDDPKEFAQALRQRKILARNAEDIGLFLAHTELSELDWVAHSIKEAYNKDEAAKLTKAFAARVGGAAAAPVFLQLLDSKASAEARAWFEANPEAGLAGLESTGGRTTAAGRQLIDVLRRKLGIESAEENASATGKARSLAVLETLPDGLAQAFASVRKKRAKPPKWISAADLPYIEIDGARLSDNDVNQLLSVLSAAAPRPPHPLLLALRCYADAGSLDTFAEALFNTWRTVGMPGKDKWALLAMGSLGSDRSALRIAPQVREWPGESKHQAATWGLEVLQAIGTDTAILQIDQIARKVKFQALKKSAQETMEAIAEDRGLTRDELEDRIVADCGLDERGSRVFDFGPRQFKFRLGPNLKPVAIDGENNRRDDLPKPTLKDDPDLAKKAVDDWKLLKKQVAEVVKAQVARLEAAQVTQRRWSAADFRSLVVAHPILGQMILPLIWGAYRGSELVGTFRVTEDRTFANASDDTFELPADAEIGLPHPAGLEGAALNQWGEVLSDYALIPPFPQLSRPINRLEPGEAELVELTRFGDFKLEPVVYAGIAKRLGYMTGEVGDGGSINSHAKWFPTSKLTAIIENTGMSIGFYDGMDPASIERVYFIPESYGRGRWFDDRSMKKVRLGDVDAVVMSEVLSDLRVLSSRAAEGVAK